MTEPRPCLSMHPNPADHHVRCRPCWLYLHSPGHAARWGNPDPATPGPEFLGRKAGPPPEPPGLGDAVEAALKLVGISKDRVERWVGGPCGCDERREKLNRLGRWAARVLSRKKPEG